MTSGPPPPPPPQPPPPPPSPTRYFTASGQPPNGGLVPSNYRVIYEVDDPPADSKSTPQAPPPNECQARGLSQDAASTSLSSVMHLQNCVILASFVNPSVASYGAPVILVPQQLWPLTPGLPAIYSVPCTQTTPIPIPAPVEAGGNHAAPAQIGAPASPAEQNLALSNQRRDPDPLALVSDGHLYHFPEKYMTVHFLDEGERPCDGHPRPWTQPFAFEKVRVPCRSKVKELVRRLLLRARTPDRRACAVQEMSISQRGPEGIVFQAGIRLEQHGRTSNWTLKDLGWGDHRGDDDPVYLVLCF